MTYPYFPRSSHLPSGPISPFSFLWLFLFSSVIPPLLHFFSVGIIHGLALCAYSSISPDGPLLFRTYFSFHDYDLGAPFAGSLSLLIWDLSMKLLDRKYLKPGMIKPKIYRLHFKTVFPIIFLSFLNPPYSVMISGNSPVFP